MKFKEKHGIDELARIGDELLKGSNLRQQKSQAIVKSLQDPIYERDKLVVEWTKNILIPSCISLQIAGNTAYSNFIEKCKFNFGLFLDQILTADDFEKRLIDDLKKFGGEEEELMKPIHESIANSLRFLELARIDDPSLSILLTIIDEERENSRRGYT